MLELKGMVLRGRKGTGVRGLLLFMRYYPEKVLIPLLFLVTFFTVFYYGQNSRIYSISDDTLQVSGDAETCTFTSNVTSAHTKTVNPGSTQSGIGTTKITTKCTNSIEHKVYAIGYSNNTDGNTGLINSSDNVTIATGTATSGDVSNWAMLIAKDTSSYEPSNLTITNSFGSYHVVPSTSTQVSGYSGATDATTGSSITTTYRAKLSSSQLAGTYVGKVKYTLTATMFYTVTIKTATGVSKVTLNGVECTSTSGCQVTNLTEGETYTLVATLATGYNFSTWSTPENGTIAGATTASTTFTVGGGDATITPSVTPKTYTITLNKNGATTAGSSSTTATYGATTLAAITRPQREYNISGFTLPASNGATGAEVSSTNTVTSTYTFNGWYKESGATNKIASNAATPVLAASTSYTTSNGTWSYNGARTLYAGWTAQMVSLPTITKQGYDCGWTETATDATTKDFQTGDSLTPTRDYTLYGVCIPIDYTITIDAGAGTTTLTLSGWSGTGTATLTKTFHIGDTIDLSAITPTYRTGYSGTKIIKNDSYGSLSDSIYTVGAGNGSITISASALDTPVCTVTGGSGNIVHNYVDTTITATSNSSSYDSSTVNITYAFGYGSSASNTLGNFSSAQASNSYTVARNAFKGSRYYGVRVVVTDKTDSTITATCTSGTGTGTGSTVAARATVGRVNSIIRFDATTNGGTLNGTTPLYVAYLGTVVYTSRTNSTTGTIPTAEPPTGHTFDGWYTAAEGGSKVLNSSNQLTGTAVTSWSNADSQWVKTSANISNESINILYAQYVSKTYTITLNGNGATTAGSGSATAAFGSTSLSSITKPFRSYSISGFTLPASNNASGASVSSTSTLTSSYTFNGWYEESAATNLVASNDTTPVLQANTSYTDTSGQWNYDGTTTLYAGWTAQQMTLPSITKPGYDCGWTETATNATSITYRSGDPLTPGRNYTLYGVCTANNYTVTVDAGAGISTLALSGWTGTGTGTLSKSFHIGEVINLASFTPTYLTGHSGTTYVVNDSYGSISGSTYTVGAGNGHIIIKASTLATPTCTMQGGTTKVYNRSATTLTATDTSSLYESNSVDISYSFGWATSDSAALDDFSSPQSGNTFSIAKALFYGTRYYGVTVNVVSVDDSSLTATCTSGTGSSTGTTVANRTTMALVNSRVQLNAGDGTLSGTAYFYVAYGKNNKYSSRTSTSAYTLPTVTPPEDYVLDGWYTSGGDKVMNADFSLTGVAVSGWSNASPNWVKTGTSNSATATANQLYAHYTFNGTYIQNLPSASCTSTPLKVYDSRDMQSYYVKRLADGNCWMMDNLNLGATDLTVELSSTNSNFVSPLTAEVFNSWRVTTGSNTLTDGEFFNYTGNDPTSEGRYGTLYNYYAATATYFSGSTTTQNSKNDICPAGWRLPTGGQYGEYDELTKLPAFDTVAELRTPVMSGGFGLAFAGYGGVGNVAYINQLGTYWTSTRVNDTNMYYMSVNSSMIGATYSTSRGYMQSIRCVMKKTAHQVTVSYDSGIASVTLNGTSVANGSSVLLEDDAYYYIEATTNSGYNFGSYSATVGSFVTTTLGSTYYKTGTAASTITVTSAAATFTCTKQFRLQNADGTYPSTYTIDSVETLTVGDICDYVKSYTNYQTQSDNQAPLGPIDVTLSLDLPRNTYTLTVYKYSSISTVGYSGTYRWGQEIQLTATPNLAEGYRFYQWAHYNSENEGTFSSTTITNPTYTMPIGNASIVASGRKNYFQERLYSYCGYPMWDYRTNTSYKTVIINTWCYMAENLDLPGGTTVESTHSHVSSSYTLPASSTGASTGVYNSGTRDCSSGGPCYSYYNWTVATAGTNPTFGMAEADICPRYWRLLQQNDLDRISSYHYTNQIPLTSAPFEGNASGLYSTSGGYNNSNTIMFWAGANHYVGPDNARSGYAYNATSATYFGNAQYMKDVRAGVRCVMANTNTLSSATTMQSVAPDMILNSANGATATLTDSRDTSVSYGVLKAANSLWMTDNLKVLGGATISNTASNITSSTSYTLPASVTSPAYWTNSNTSAVLYTGTASTTGGYYNHVAATATIQNTTAANNASVMNQPMQSICPRPWRIPTYHELADLVSSFGTQMINLLGLAKNGYIASGGSSMSGYYGFWWTMTTSATDATKAYILTETPSNTLTLQLVDKYYGANIRCIYNS